MAGILFLYVKDVERFDDEGRGDGGRIAILFSKKLVFFFVIIIMMTFFVSKNKVYKRVIRVKNVSRFNDQLDYFAFCFSSTKQMHDSISTKSYGLITQLPSY